ncbi:MAG TPA: allantoate amidohydrolase [Steroidobacteraceae bacterium]|nr:allantoate amidohydrolase [Steroidobacteraceae bacterium]
MIPLQQLNSLDAAQFASALGAIYEHSPWVPDRVAALRPFATLRALHAAMSQAVAQADLATQLALIRAHPELAGKAAIRGDLTPESTSEQKGAGLASCTPQQYAQLQTLNAAYNQRFGFPFILAVKGHTPDSVIAELAQRVEHDVEREREVALQQIGRIARFRLGDLVAEAPGDELLSMADELAQYSEDSGGLTCSYLTPTHRATALQIRDYMLAAGLEVRIDAVGNVVGVLHGDGTNPRRLLTGSHFDTVINGGRYDGRLGILLPVIVAGALRRAGRRLPYTLEIVAFAEEEGVRFKSTFLGSRALAGEFAPALLDSVDAAGITMRAAMQDAGLDSAHIPAIARDPATLLGYVELHIEQGPVLLNEGHAVGVVSSIAGSLRSLVTVTGLAGHSGTVPMPLRHDAAAGAAEIVLAVERRCGGTPGLVGTVGRLEVPGGAINVIPGRCELSIDIRAGVDAVRDLAYADVTAQIGEIAARRGLEIEQRKVLEVASVACAPFLQQSLAASGARVTGQPVRVLPSGAGHDAMMMARITPVGMLFVRCGNGGISHHPDETCSAADAGVAAEVLKDFLLNFQVPE